MKMAKLNEDICLGCGVCVRSCTTKVIHLKPRAARVITPLDGTHRGVMMAIERGTLQNLIFDYHVLLAGVLGVILKLPPLKQVLANRQIKSRYLEALISRRLCWRT